MKQSLDIAILGLSLTSSWVNGHATTYRGLARELARRGHRVTFYERDAGNRDLPEPEFCRVVLYHSLDELVRNHERALGDADLVIVGSYVPDGAKIIDWITTFVRGVLAFYDIDTPVTLEAIRAGTCDYLHRRQIPWFDLYLSFTGGPVLLTIERELGSPAARPLYCSFDPASYYPETTPLRWDLGYIGTYSADRQPVLERLLVKPARAWRGGRFVVAGPQYPASIVWPPNVERIQHVHPDEHRRFYNAQRFTLNVTREPMVRLGYSPSVRLFEAAACAVPIVSDSWPGLDDFFEPGREIVLCESPEQVVETIHDMPEEERRAIGARARERVLRNHTAAHRALELERYYTEAVLLGRLRPRTAERPLPEHDERVEARI
ncbi:MAG: CgeB family protein [Thermoanaerobaculia bacterium]